MHSFRNILIILGILLTPFWIQGGFDVADSLEKCLFSGSDYQCISLERLAPEKADEAISMPINDLKGEIASTELQTVARHMRTVSFRMQWMAQNNKLHTRAFVRYLSKIVSTLAQCDERVYTTAKIPCWRVPSDCYVFGIRHIII